MNGDTRSIVRELSHRFPPSGFYSASEFFRTLHRCAKAETKQYSYRQLSLDLGFAATNLLHLIVQGKRPLTEKAADRIVEALELGKDERRYFLALAKLTRGKESAERAQSFREALEIRGTMMSARLEPSQHSYYAENHHAVIREMLLLEDFRPDPEWISKTVKPAISPEQAAESLKLLEKLDLIRYDEEAGRWLQTSVSISSGSEEVTPIVRQYHEQVIPQGLEALKNEPLERRVIGGLVLSVNSVQFEQLKQEMELFQQRLLELETDRSAGPPTRVVKLNMQLYPATIQ